jgi:acetyl esterase
MSATNNMQEPRPDVAALLAMLVQMQAKPMNEGSVEEGRQAFAAMGPLVDAAPEELAIIRDLTCPGPAGDIPLRLYDARESRSAGPAMVFFHSGGFVIGDLETHHPVCTYFAKNLDIPVIAVDYRLAPEHPFPAAPDDCEAAARWIAKNASSIGLDITGLALCGDSAGGNLAISVTHALMAKPAAVPVVAQFAIYPATDSASTGGTMEEFADGYLLTAKTMDWFMEQYKPELGNPRHEVIHTNHAASPPTLVFTAGLDPLRDQGCAYAKAVEAAGVRVIYDEATGNLHNFLCLRKAIPSTAQDMERMIGHMRSLLNI